MGTTVAGLVVTDEQVITFNIGDSRVYEIVPDGLRQVSVDDRPSNGGALARHTVLQTLGGSVELSTVEPHVSSSPRPADACYLICTDGLGDVVPIGELARIVHDHRDGRAAFELWKAAIDAGGPDNITLAVIRLSTGREAAA
jgi:serine/threonine protein phosphatase PrpC